MKTGREYHQSILRTNTDETGQRDANEPTNILNQWSRANWTWDYTNRHLLPLYCVEQRSHGMGYVLWPRYVTFTRFAYAERKALYQSFLVARWHAQCALPTGDLDSRESNTNKRERDIYVYTFKCNTTQFPRAFCETKAGWTEDKMQ